jgi:hypothetical protein
MTETEATVKVLDRCATRFNPIYSAASTGLTKVWEIDTKMLVGLRRDSGLFVGATNLRRLMATNSFWSGFEMLENLAIHPKFAKKLAEPIND